MTNISLPLANLIYSISGIVIVIGALATLAGTAAAIWSSGIREQHANERIAANEAETASALVEAARANQATEEAKLEQETLKAQLAWRTLSEEMASILLRRISEIQGRVVLAYMSSDPEAQFFAIQLARPFGEAQWDIRSENRTYSSGILFGLFIPGPETEEVLLVRDAFREAGIEFRADDVPPPAIAAGSATEGMSTNDRPLVTIMVGSKLPPF